MKCYIGCEFNIDEWNVIEFR